LFAGLNLKLTIWTGRTLGTSVARGTIGTRGSYRTGLAVGTIFAGVAIFSISARGSLGSDGTFASGFSLTFALGREWVSRLGFGGRATVGTRLTTFARLALATIAARAAFWAGSSHRASTALDFRACSLSLGDHSFDVKFWIQILGPCER
jgi:hypothetical protein